MGASGRAHNGANGQNRAVYTNARAKRLRQDQLDLERIQKWLPRIREAIDDRKDVVEIRKLVRMGRVPHKILLDRGIFPAAGY